MKTTRRRLLVRILVGLLASLALFVLVVAVDSWVPSGQAPRGPDLARLRASAQYQEDHFVDLIPRREPEFWPTLSRWLAGAPHTVPDTPLPIVATTAFTAPPVSGLRITWLGHSSVLVELDGATVLFDPIWSQRCSPLSFIGPERFHPPPVALEALPALSAVVISHDHYDHLDHETIVRLNESGTHFFVPLGVGSHLRYWGVDASRIVELDWWQSVRVGEVEMTATPARHFSGRSLVMADRDATLWAGWALVGPRHRVFYSGDTGMFPGFSEIGQRLGPFDATLFEVGAYNQLWSDVHLGPEQAMSAHEMVRGGLLIPVHWGTFDLALHAWTEPMERLLVGSRERGIRLATPRPGESIEPSLAPPPERWWPEVPWQTAAEAPVVASGL